MTPFLALPAALAIEQFRALGTVAVVVSIFLIASATLLNASPAFRHDGNYFTMYTPEILEGHHAPKPRTMGGTPRTLELPPIRDVAYRWDDAALRIAPEGIGRAVSGIRE